MTFQPAITAVLAGGGVDRQEFARWLRRVILMDMLPVAAGKAAFAHDRTQQAAGRTRPLRIGLARPGVMIGGDWAKGRVLADVVVTISEERPVSLAAPGAIRPWQHVLDGVSGALTLAARLWAGPVPRRPGAAPVRADR